MSLQFSLLQQYTIYLKIHCLAQQQMSEVKHAVALRTV